jgi:hypothetical protein
MGYGGSGGGSDSRIPAIKAKTDLIPAQPATAGGKMDIADTPNATALANIVQYLRDQVFGPQWVSTPVVADPQMSDCGNGWWTKTGDGCYRLFQGSALLLNRTPMPNQNMSVRATFHKPDIYGYDGPMFILRNAFPDKAGSHFIVRLNNFTGGGGTAVNGVNYFGQYHTFGTFDLTGIDSIFDVPLEAIAYGTKIFLKVNEHMLFDENGNPQSVDVGWLLPENMIPFGDQPVKPNPWESALYAGIRGMIAGGPYMDVSGLSVQEVTEDPGLETP